MRRVLRHIRRLPLPRLLRRFVQQDDGVAAVEFALILPLLLLLYLGSIEASSLFTVDRRVEVISTTVADLVARWNPNQGAITDDVLGDYFRAAEGIIIPYDDSRLTQVVSLLSVDEDGIAEVVWSCGYNGGVSLDPGDIYGLGEQMQTLSAGGFVVAATTRYPYRPVLGMVFKDEINLENEALFLPRFGESLDAPSGGCPT